MTDDSSEAHDPTGIVHAMEQLAAFVRDLGPTVFSYYAKLKREGFTDEQAFTLARDLQRQLVPSTNPKDGDDEDWKRNE